MKHGGEKSVQTNHGQNYTLYNQTSIIVLPLRNRTKYHLHIGDNGYQRTHGKVGAAGLRTENMCSFPWKGFEQHSLNIN